MKLISIIDPGHRKDTPGKNANGLYEYEFNECVARLVGADLGRYGEVYYTMETENHPYNEMTTAGRNQNLNYRTSKANAIYWDAVKKYGKDNFKIIFVSIHANAFDNPNVSGYEIFVYRHGGEAHKLAKAINGQAQLILGVGINIKDRGIKEANFAVLRNTIMPAVLIEHEFYTNLIAAKKLLGSEFRKKCSDHIVKGILDYADITPIAKTIYRVRKSWEDSKSQEGAYSVLENAIGAAKKHTGYNVYDDKGNQVYPVVQGDDDMTLEYKKLLKYGMRGDDVKKLQEVLAKLGYNTKGIDGIWGNGTENAVKQFQKDNKLVVDGLVGRNTINKINDLLKNVSIKNIPKYYSFGSAKIKEVNPLALYIEIAKKANNKIKGDFINGCLYSRESMKSISTLVSDGKVLAEQLEHDQVKRGTFVVYKNGKVSVEMIDFISKYPNLKNIKFAIGGFNLMPQNCSVMEELKKEWFDYNAVGYTTWRTMIGYSKAKNRALMVIAPNTDAVQGRALMKKIGCDCAISLDSGGSTSGRFDRDTIRTTTRAIHNIIRWC